MCCKSGFIILAVLLPNHGSTLVECHESSTMIQGLAVDHTSIDRHTLLVSNRDSRSETRRVWPTTVHDMEDASSLPGILARWSGVGLLSIGRTCFGRAMSCKNFFRKA